jgi:para-nitrobenzyl esterase
MVWVHGGALIVGQSDLYDPTALVAQGVVVVTINYRLGALGFLTLPSLGSLNGSAGNYGLLDQQAALKWVQTNIAGFGGDPTNVTLFGESAGGLSTHSQIVSPLAKGLFTKAIVESGAYSLTAASMAQASSAGSAFATAAGCPNADAACLLALPVSSILAHNTLVEIGGTGLPTVDGVVLPQTIIGAIAAGSFNKVPVMEGNNQHEYSLLSAIGVDIALGHEIGATDYPTQINAAFGPQLGGAIQTAYPLTLPHTPAWIYDNVFTDLVFACRGREMAQALNIQNVPVYTYEFADPSPPLTSSIIFPGIGPRKEGYGAYHSSEIQFVFPSAINLNFLVTPVTSAVYTRAETALSAQMVGFWSQFAKSGNPNVAGSTAWPAYTVANDTYMTLAPGATASTNGFSAEHNCDSFWVPSTLVGSAGK